MAISERAIRRTIQAIPVRPVRPSQPGFRLLIPVVAFAVAFGLDVLSDRRWSSVFGGSALAVSAAAFARIRRLLLPVGAYAGAWVGFNVLRAFADNPRGVLLSRDAVSRAESWLAGGELPSAFAQRTVLDPTFVGPHHVVVTAVYLSYFVVPHVVATVLLWRTRRTFRRYLLATLVLFAIGLAGFLLLPTNPPWLASESGGPDVGEIVRVPDRTLAAAGIDLRRGESDRQGYAFEPNAVASMPSMHLGVTALLAVIAWGSRGYRRWLALGYACAMAYALVASGEHYVLDISAGAAAAVVAWHVSERWPGASDREGESGAPAARGAAPA